MNPRYRTQNLPTSILKLLHVSTHIIGFHFWKHSAILIISMSVSDILFNQCGVFVECFRFFMAANINFVWRRFEASLQLALDMLSTCLRHAHGSLRPGLQLYRIMECGLKWATGQPRIITYSSYLFALLADPSVCPSVSLSVVCDVRSLQHTQKIKLCGTFFAQTNSWGISGAGTNLKVGAHVRRKALEKLFTVPPLF